MNKFLSVLMISALLVGCALKSRKDLRKDGPLEPNAALKVEPSKEPAKPIKNAPIVVDDKDLNVLEQMNKSVEDYIVKKDKIGFQKLCRNKHFDCWINNKPFPPRKKKIPRKVPPYASGSKMGLHGEERVHIRYEFYP